MFSDFLVQPYRAVTGLVPSPTNGCSANAIYIIVFPLAFNVVSLSLNLNPLDKKSISKPVVSAFVPLGNKAVPIGFIGVLHLHRLVRLLFMMRKC